MAGLFITFEGPDGSGKSTQIKQLASYLEAKQIPFILTREPGGTEISDEIRATILNPSFVQMKNETEVLLYSASRAQHVREKIIPGLEEGKIVLCDRYIDASIAYQGYGLGIPIKDILNINEFATGGLRPHRSYFIDLSPELGRKRMESRYGGSGFDRIEQKSLEYHEKVRCGFHEIVKNDHSRFCCLDGKQSIDEIFLKIKEDFNKLWDNYIKMK
jgi:dTMP kinase